MTESKTKKINVLDLDQTNKTINLLLHKKACVDKSIDIPYNLVIIDAFQNQTLTPLSELSYMTEQDYVSLIAWQITNTWLNNQIVQFKIIIKQSLLDRSVLEYKPSAIKIVLTLLMSAVSCKEISNLPISFIDNAITEVIDKANIKQKEECIPETNFFFAETLYEIVFRSLNNFWVQYIDKISPPTLDILINNLMRKYETIAKECTETVAKGAKKHIIYSYSRFKHINC